MKTKVHFNKSVEQIIQEAGAVNNFVNYVTPDFILSGFKYRHAFSTFGNISNIEKINSYVVEVFHNRKPINYNLTETTMYFCSFGKPIVSM